MCSKVILDDNKNSTEELHQQLMDGKRECVHADIPQGTIHLFQAIQCFYIKTCLCNDSWCQPAALCTNLVLHTLVTLETNLNQPCNRHHSMGNVHNSSSMRSRSHRSTLITTVSVHGAALELKVRPVVVSCDNTSVPLRTHVGECWACLRQSSIAFLLFW